MLDRRNQYSDSPKMTDPLSDVLALLEAESFVSTGMEAGGAWSVHVSAHTGLKFNAVVRGQAWLAIQGRTEALRVTVGDCFLLARGHPFTLSSELDVAAVDAETVFSAADGSVARIGDGADFRVVGGKMVLDPLAAGLLTEALPDCILLPACSDQAKAMHWLLARFTTEIERDAAGGPAAAANLMHLMFLELMRAHLAAAPQGEQGWLYALSDPRIGKALRLMHGAPSHGWTLLELAKATGMSRSSFAEHFRQRVGVPPLEYLLQWRMRLARRDLVRRRHSVGQVAERYGYGSESSFGSAFKRVFGDAPRRSIAGLAASREV